MFNLNKCYLLLGIQIQAGILSILGLVGGCIHLATNSQECHLMTSVNTFADEHI